MVLPNTQETSSEHPPFQTFQTWFTTCRLVGPNLELYYQEFLIYMLFSQLVDTTMRRCSKSSDINGLPTPKGWELYRGGLRFSYLPCPFINFQLKCGLTFKLEDKLYLEYNYYTKCLSNRDFFLGINLKILLILISKICKRRKLHISVVSDAKWP